MFSEKIQGRLRLGILAALCLTPAMAGVVTISTGGTWGALSGSSAYFASNEAWTLSFQVTDPPPLTSIQPTEFATTYSNAVYTLNGSSVAVTGSEALFVTTQSFIFCLDTVCTNSLETGGGAPLFTGTTSNPSFVPPGPYSTGPAGFFAESNNNFLGSAPGDQIITVASSGQTPGVPEPATWILTATGVLLAAAAKARPVRRRRAA